MNNLVDIVGIGTNKAATTWIHACVSEHPQICGSNPKETHFFGKNYSKGLDWYASCFQNCSDGQLKFEYSPDYLQDFKALQRIKKNVPDVKIIVCVRNPIERALSAYEFNKERGAHGFTSFDEYVFSHFQKGSIPFKKARYGELIQKTIDIFGKENVLVLFFEDIAKDSSSFISSIYSFMGIDETFTPPSLTIKVNKTSSGVVRYLPINRAIHEIRFFLNKYAVLNPVRASLKAIGINRFVEHILKKNRKKSNTLPAKKKETISASTFQQLCTYYEGDVKLLESITNRNLKNWLNQTNS